MTLRSAVLFKVISGLSVATSLQCSASRASNSGFRIKASSGLRIRTPAEAVLFKTHCARSLKQGNPVWAKRRRHSSDLDPLEISQIPPCRTTPR